MLSQRRRSPARLQPPRQTHLPYIAYGLLKPGELAHRQIVEFLGNVPTQCEIEGSLWHRDGLPLLDPSPGGRVKEAYLLHFRPESSALAYRRIAEFEPGAHYRWETVRLPNGAIANVLVGVDPRQGSVEIEEGKWNGRSDPVFTDGLKVVREVLDAWGDAEFCSAPPDSFDWPRLFRMQMAYLLLWSAIERYAGLAFGPALNEYQKRDALGSEAMFVDAFRKGVNRVDTVYDARDLRPYTLDPANPGESLHYYHAVRSNIIHRGKGAWKDGNTVLHALSELLGVFEAVLKRSWGATLPPESSPPRETSRRGY